MFPDFKKIFQHLIEMGFFYQNSSIYNGLANAWDYGPLGASLKRNLKTKLYDFFIFQHDNVVEIDTNIILHPQVWAASGHVKEFCDFYATCVKCNTNFKCDRPQDADNCPKCQSPQIQKPRSFNLLFQTNYGLLTTSPHFLRPETSQGIFINFANIVRSTRMKLPFGVGQFGKSFRNEITPSHTMFRTREFEQFELVYFVRQQSVQREFERILDNMKRFLDIIGIKKKNYQIHDHCPAELAHYATKTCDINFRFPFGWAELWGLSNRGVYDLQQHQASSKVSLQYFEAIPPQKFPHQPYHNESEEVKSSRFFPHEIESSVGIDRLVLAILCQAFTIETLPDENQRIILQLTPEMAPFQIMVTALATKLNKLAHQKIFTLLKKETRLRIYYDTNSNIGKKYRRADAIGVCFCVTYDYQTNDDQAVTIRDRISMKQTRVAINKLISFLNQHVNSQN